MVRDGRNAHRVERETVEGEEGRCLVEMGERVNVWEHGDVSNQLFRCGPTRST
jgi:hypothetical protein